MFFILYKLRIVRLGWSTQKYRFEVIKCIGYDMNLARIIQENHHAQ